LVSEFDKIGQWVEIAEKGNYRGGTISSSARRCPRKSKRKHKDLIDRKEEGVGEKKRGRRGGGGTEMGGLPISYTEPDHSPSACMFHTSW
jgi:hypothetical protein